VGPASADNLSVAGIGEVGRVFDNARRNRIEMNVRDNLSKIFEGIDDSCPIAALP